jgi:hypothetical protein
MRKRYWVLLAIMVLGGVGNLIGGTDTPVRGAVDPAATPGAVQADVPVAPRFDATLFVSASSLNLREVPSMGARVLTSCHAIPRCWLASGEAGGFWSRPKGRWAGSASAI